MALGEIGLEPNKKIPALINVIDREDDVSWISIKSIEKYNSNEIFPYRNVIHKYASSSRTEVSNIAKNILTELTLCSNSNYEIELFDAIMSKDVNRVTSLLQSGANSNAIDSAGRSALQCSCYYGNVDIVKTLILHGANTNSSYMDKSLLDIAIAGGDPLIIQYIRAIPPPGGLPVSRERSRD
jgi:ankyrin repeat protein